MDSHNDGFSFIVSPSIIVDESAKFTLLTSKTWLSDSLLANGVIADGPGQMLEKFKGQVIFNDDGTGEFGGYGGTWYFAFEETALSDGSPNPDTGRRYLETILEAGGSRPALDSFMAFRGREPSLNALLRHQYETCLVSGVVCNVACNNSEAV